MNEAEARLIHRLRYLIGADVGISDDEAEIFRDAYRAILAADSLCLGVEDGHEFAHDHDPLDDAVPDYSVTCTRCGRKSRMVSHRVELARARRREAEMQS